ncbi:hypothetical protein BD779DRAFT_1547898 [Infundibulicybe gibba]|nr:hypothetical protein BD779DRAFT_1547898 [Infundibulicybe gibba]
MIVRSTRRCPSEIQGQSIHRDLRRNINLFMFLAGTCLACRRAFSCECLGHGFILVP